MRKHLLTTTAAMLLAMTGVAFADMEAAKKFLDAEVGDAGRNIAMSRSAIEVALMALLLNRRRRVPEECK
mgnify:CR=1 FL=1